MENIPALCFLTCYSEHKEKMLFPWKSTQFSIRTGGNETWLPIHSFALPVGAHRWGRRRGNRREHPSSKRLREEDNENQSLPMFHQTTWDKKANFQVRATAHHTKSSCHNSVRIFLSSPNLQVCPRWRKGAWRGVEAVRVWRQKYHCYAEQRRCCLSFVLQHLEHFKASHMLL